MSYDQYDLNPTTTHSPKAPSNTLAVPQSPLKQVGFAEYVQDYFGLAVGEHSKVKVENALPAASLLYHGGIKLEHPCWSQLWCKIALKTYLSKFLFVPKRAVGRTRHDNVFISEIAMFSFKVYCPMRVHHIHTLSLSLFTRGLPSDLQCLAFHLI